MSVIIQETDANFTKIANNLIIDKNLSNGAKVLYCYLRSKPNNWKIINADIVNNLQISQDSVAKYFKELIENNWIERQKEKDDKGQFNGGYNYKLFDIPKNTEYGKSPDMEKNHIPKNVGNNNNTKTTNNTNFIKPTPDQINEYCKEIEVRIDANNFIDFYEAKGWIVSGKSKMKDWKAAIRLWARRSGQVIKDKKQQTIPKQQKVWNEAPKVDNDKFMKMVNDLKNSFKA